MRRSPALNSFRYASRKDWSAIARDLKPVYTAATEAAALERGAADGPPISAGRMWS